MSVVRNVLTILLAFAMAATACRKFLGDKASLALRDTLLIPPRVWLVVGALEGAAVLGLLSGFFAPPLAVAAATGVALTMVGAVLAHLRLHIAGRALTPPLTVFTFAVATAASWLMTA